MSAWKAGKIEWFSDDFEEGLIVDTENGDFYYLNLSAAKKLKSIKKKYKLIKNLKFKIQEGPRSIRAIDIKIDN